MGAGPLAVPTNNPGTEAAGVSDLRVAIEQLQKILPSFPVGSEQHKAVLNAVKSLSTHAAPSNEVPGQQNVALRNLMATAGKNANIQQLMRSAAMGGQPGPGSGGQPGAPPSPTTPGGIPGGPPAGGGVPGLT